MGLVLAAVPLPGLSDAAGLVVGVSPTLDQRAAMAMFASVMAHSVHVVGEGVPDVPVVDMTFEDAFGDQRSDGTARGPRWVASTAAARRSNLRCRACHRRLGTPGRR